MAAGPRRWGRLLERSEAPRTAGTEGTGTLPGPTAAPPGGGQGSAGCAGRGGASQWADTGRGAGSGAGSPGAQESPERRGQGRDGLPGGPLLPALGPARRMDLEGAGRTRLPRTSGRWGGICPGVSWRLGERWAADGGDPAITRSPAGIAHLPALLGERGCGDSDRPAPRS